MVMTGVVPPLREMFVNIDTRFGADFNNTPIHQADFTVTLPQKITKVKSMSVVQAEMPISFNNVSSYLNNASIVFTSYDGETVVDTTVYTIENAYYTTASFTTYIQANLPPYLTSFALTATNRASFGVDLSGNTRVDVSFSVDASGNFDKYDLKTKIGWLLGFRQAYYSFTAAGTWTSEAAVDFTSPRYVYLVVDDFQNTGNDTAFVSPLYKSLISKKILARFSGGVIQVNQGCTFSNVYDFNKYTGLTSQTRTYGGSGGQLQRLHVSLLDEFGRVLDLNGLDFSFLLRLECE
jgi:hypothetical protein